MDTVNEANVEQTVNSGIPSEPDLLNEAVAEANEGEKNDTPPTDGEQAPMQSASETDYERLEREDIAELCREFPELKIDSLTELDNPLRYGALRDMGLTPTEAYLATRKGRGQTPAPILPPRLPRVPHSEQEACQEPSLKWRESSFTACQTHR